MELPYNKKTTPQDHCSKKNPSTRNGLHIFQLWDQ